MIKENLEEVREHIRQACERAGRDPGEVTLIAVSKTKPVPLLREAYDAGARDFGENKVQELVAKEPELPGDIRWHMIGHLQRNKVHQVLGKAVLIHSVDSLRLAEQIERTRRRRGLDVDILLEVNVAREESKFGFLTEEVEEAVQKISALPHVHIKGLNALSQSNPEENREIFKNCIN